METVDELLLELRNYKQKHEALFKAVFYADENRFGMMDMLISATLNRSLCLIRGFCDLLGSMNFVAAVPLLRLQIDNCMRLAAAWFVDDPHHFALEILNGTPVRKQKDRSGKLMVDKYLLGKLAEEYPWASKVYGNTSGYIHLSEKHFFNAMHIDSEKDGTVITKLSDYDEFVPEQSYVEVIEAFKAITDILLEYVYGWACTKSGTILSIPGFT